MKSSIVLIYMAISLVFGAVLAEEIKKDSVDIVKEVATNVEDEVLKQLPVFGMTFINQQTNTTNLNKINVRDDYKLKVGDTLLINVFGYDNSIFTLLVDKKGEVVIPKYGPIRIVNEEFGVIKKALKQALKEVYPNSDSIISMDEISSIELTISGNVKAPGTYMLGAYSTLIDALRVSKGFTENSSFRNITLTRNGKNKNIDLYEYLLGDKNFNDLLLQDGDIITINIAHKQVGIEGEVKQEGIFELKPKEGLHDLLRFSKGLTPQAKKSGVILKRFLQDVGMALSYIDLDKNIDLKDGDYIKVGQLLKDEQLYITVSGEVTNSTSHLYVKNMTLGDAIKMSEGFTHLADTEGLLITRTDINKGRRTSEIITTSELGIPLQPYDHITVRRLQNWESLIEVDIKGGVFSPGIYRLNHDATVQEILTIAQGFNKIANPKGMYVIRASLKAKQEAIRSRAIEKLQSQLSAAIYASMFDEKASSDSKIKIMNIQTQIAVLQSELKNPQALGRIYVDVSTPNGYTFTLKDKDQVYVPIIENYISIEGDVLHAGTFPYDSSKTLDDYIQKAGGLRSSACMANSYVLKTNGEAVKIALENGEIVNSILEPGDIIIIGSEIARAK